MQQSFLGFTLIFGLIVASPTVVADDSHLLTPLVNRIVGHFNESPPMAYFNGTGDLEGYEVGLIRGHGEHLGVEKMLEELTGERWEIQLEPTPDPSDRFQGIREGNADFVFGSTTDTYERRANEPVLITAPTEKSDLSVLVRWDAGMQTGANLYATGRALFASWPWLAGVGIFSLFFVGALKSKRSVSVLAGGLVILCLTFCVVGLKSNADYHFAMEAAAVANIKGPRDLLGNRVATERNTTSIAALTHLGLDADDPGEVLQCESVEAAIELLLSEEVEAVVFDTPVLQYYLSGAYSGQVRIVGRGFAPQFYSMAVTEQKPELAKLLSEALLRVQESPLPDRLAERYYGRGNPPPLR